jgi:purine-binding chemotaxis protein CheW
MRVGTARLGRGIYLSTWGSTDSTTDGLSPGTDSDGSLTGEHETFHALGSSPDAPRLLVFAAAGRTCACELSVVREIIPHRKATRLPGTPPFVVGLINLRGSIVTVLDLGVRLGGTPVDVDRGSIVLVESGPRVVGLAVDELRDVQRVPRSAIESADARTTPDGSPPEPRTSNPEPRFVCGMLRVADEVAALLDVSRIVADALGMATSTRDHSPERS